MADKHDLLGTQQSVDGVAALCAFMVAACLVALPTVPCACSFVVLCHVVPAVFWQLTPSAGAPKIPSDSGETGGGSYACGHLGPCATVSQDTGFCYLLCVYYFFLSRRVPPFSSWFFEDGSSALLPSKLRKDHV